MRNRKGFSMVELLCVLLMIALIVVVVVRVLWVHIDTARGSALISQARLVHVAAHVVMTETLSDGVSDEDYMIGLSGAVNDADWPDRVMVSRRINALLYPDLFLSNVPGPDSGSAAFTIKDGVIESMVYQAYSGRHIYAVTIADGETTVVRVPEPQ